MRDRFSIFKKNLPRILDLPDDVLLGLPKITMIGSLHAYVENHQGLLFFSEKEIHIKTQNGLVKIVGNAFVLKMMLYDEVLIEGEINDVTFELEK